MPTTIGNGGTRGSATLLSIAIVVNDRLVIIAINTMIACYILC